MLGSRVGRGRSRLFGLGAALAVLIAGGGLLSASAAGSVAGSASAFVPITPCRLFDTRADTTVGTRNTPVGNAETFVAQATGTNGHCSLPAEATGLSLNVVAVNATRASFLTVFPADQPLPLASSLNWVAGQAPTPNAVTVALSADGKVSFFNATGAVDIAADVVGYYVPSISSPAGPKPARVLWVASANGDFSSVKAALAAIGTTLPTATVDSPYVIMVAPGTYDEAGGIDLKDYVDIEGSGQDTTTITCICGSAVAPSTDGSSATVRVTGPGVHSEIRDVTITNTGSFFATAMWTKGTTAGQVSMSDVTAKADSGDQSVGVYNLSSSPAMTNVTATGIAGFFGYGVYNSSSSPAMTNVTATGIADRAYGVYGLGSSPTITNLTATATDTGVLGYGVLVDGGATVMRGSFITGSSASIVRSSGSIIVFDTEFNGNSSGLTGSCYNAFTTALTPYTCL